MHWQEICAPLRMVVARLPRDRQPLTAATSSLIVQAGTVPIQKKRTAKRALLSGHSLDKRASKYLPSNHGGADADALVRTAAHVAAPFRRRLTAVVERGGKAAGGEGGEANERALDARRGRPVAASLFASPLDHSRASDPRAPLSGQSHRTGARARRPKMVHDSTAAAWAYF